MDANLIGVLAGTIALIGSCSGAGPDAAAAHTQPITSRALAAQALTHLPDRQWGTAMGGQDTSESGDEQVHYATWSLPDDIDLFVAVSREPADERDFDGTCSGEEGPATLSCREVTVHGQKVVVVSSNEDLTGGIYQDGITWAAAARRANGDAVVASLMIPAIGKQKGWREGESLPVSLETLLDIAADPQIAMKSSPEVIENGERLRAFTSVDD